ncbi:MAG: hypothetical protein FWF81_08630 [Defluviitaleaceae bacterium]|nr:hypothetical protein [Defluviitaleaceae bacterium]
MNCSYNYCLYNENGSCKHKTITINDVGMCDDCIIVSLNDDFLAAEKLRQLREIDERWEKSKQ